MDLEQKQHSSHNEPMSNQMIIIGLINAMIGGTILVLPLIGIKTGYIMTFIVSSALAYISYYTAYLTVLHMGKGKNVRQFILVHFQNDYKYLTLYCFMIWLSFLPVILIYFRLICLQVEGLMGYHSVWIGSIATAALLLTIILARIYHVGEETIAYGIISIITYIGFLIWAHITAPAGPKTMEPVGQPLMLASTLIMAYSVHDLIPQNILRSPNKEQYPKLIAYTFIIGSITYTFIAYGSFAMLNRIPIRSHPQTVNDYFAHGQWQITLIQVLFLVHLFSTIPNFVIISKQSQFFRMFKVQVRNKISWYEVAYIIACIVLCYIVYYFNVHVQIMILINGSIVCFTYVIAIPIWMHFKCVFYDRSSGFIEGDQEWNQQIILNTCECNNVYRSKWTLYLQTFFLILVIIIGVYFMISAILNPSKATSHHS